VLLVVVVVVVMVVVVVIFSIPPLPSIVIFPLVKEGRVRLRRLAKSCSNAVLSLLLLLLLLLSLSLLLLLLLLVLLVRLLLLSSARGLFNCTARVGEGGGEGRRV